MLILVSFKCSELSVSNQCVNDLSCIHFDTIQNILETDSGLTRRFKFRSHEQSISFAEQKKATRSRETFLTRNGGAGPRARASAGRLPPISWKKSVFRVVIFSFFCKTTKLFSFPKLKLSDTSN